VRVSLWTLVLFCNGLHIRLRCAVEWILRRMTLWTLMLHHLEA
jgi:hypothetical protein